MQCTRRAVVAGAAVALSAAACALTISAGMPDDANPGISRWNSPNFESLQDLSVPALRARTYGAELIIEKQLGSMTEDNEYNRHFSADGSAPYNTYVASYHSDGYRIYTRIDVPVTAPPSGGYPVVVFIHGWYGRDGAPAYDFLYKPDSIYSRAIDAYVDAGFLVFSPALRGHGEVNDIPAEGIEFLDAWDNSTYLSPMYYAIDVLNLLEGMGNLEDLDWSGWGYEDGTAVRLDLSRIHISGMSQGADAGLTVLAVSGEGSGIRNTVASGSMWSGCFAPRFEQLEVYGPMAETLEAFMSGDGSWTGTALGRDGSSNPNFVFGWPPDWIETTDTGSPDWTWQADSWAAPSVADVFQRNYAEMYEVLNRQVADIDGAEFKLVFDEYGRVSVRHDAQVTAAMERIGGYAFEKLLSEPLLLHHSNQDYYAIPRWNADLAKRVNRAGGKAFNFTYSGNTHFLLLSQHEWFSGPDRVEGFDIMIARDIALMRGRDPGAVGRFTVD